MAEKEEKVEKAEKAVPEKKKTGSGLPSNTAAALSYVLGWLTGVIFLLIEKDDKFVRFHAMQSIITFGALNILWVIPGINIFLGPFLAIVGFILWLILIYKAYQGEEFKLPVIGDYAKKWVAKV